MWIELFLAKLAAALAPGPNTVFVAAVSASGGRWAGLAAALGILAAEMVWASAASAIASGALRVVDPPRYVLDTLAAGALFWLGRRLLSPSRRPSPSTLSRKGYGVIGLAVGLSNPLVLIFYAGLFPRIVSGDAAHGGAHLGCVAVVLAATALALLCYASAPALIARARPCAPLGTAAGAVLCGLGFVSAFSAMSGAGIF